MDKYDQARTIALVLLRDVGTPTPEVIREKVMTACTAMGAEEAEVDVERLCRDIETSLTVWVGPAATLDAKDEDHKPWLSQTMQVLVDGREQPEWLFWKRYHQFLLEVRKWPEGVLGAIDRATTDVLFRLEDPARLGSWDRRGMVVGLVQSGKTAHIIGLSSKAVDAGYKLIVVLTGMHNNLRAQTQFRLDEEFLGFDTDKSLSFDMATTRIGVGLLPGPGKKLRVHSLTSSNERGDFNTRIAQTVGVLPGGSDPILLVVKKHGGVLRNLTAWAKSVVADNDGIIRGVPLLVIDDECDQASINTKPLEMDDADYDVTAINAGIRRLLKAFDQKSYVGYTATPFATIFIPPEHEHATLAEDLFPRSFIVSLDPPSDYIGPVEVFGLDPDPDVGMQARAGQPVVRTIDDHEEWVPDRHDRAYVMPTTPRMPASLAHAIRAFILSNAARRQRGQGREHNSMLIHVSRFVAVQQQVTQRVTAELQDIQRRIRYGDGASNEKILDELRQIWETDFEPTTGAVVGGDQAVPWERIVPHISPAAAKIQMKEINGSALDILDYRRHREEGLSVIVIGGDKLSRGLTLEGLTVSYYLRATRMYDTLMQMGRWFGYRAGYNDLCRIYTTQELSSWYRWIALAMEELREDFKHMAAIGATPQEFGLRVREHPGTLLVTALNKMQAATGMRLSFADTLNQTLVLERNPAVQARNFNVVDRFVASLSVSARRKSDSGHGIKFDCAWDGVPAERIVDLLASFNVHRDARRTRPELLRRYIEAQTKIGDLTSWTVGLVSDGKGRLEKIGGLDVRCVIRNALSDLSTTDKVGVKTVISPDHEALDLTLSEYDGAFEATKTAWQAAKDGITGRPPRSEREPSIPSPGQIRAARPPGRGLLLLYPVDPAESAYDDQKAGVRFERAVIALAISFPRSEHAMSIEYQVNMVYAEELAA